MKKVSFIGLGQMGGPMAKNLIKNDFETYVLTATRSKIEKYVELGAHPLQNAAEAVQKTDAIVMCVLNDDVMRGLVEEMLTADLTGKIFIDSTSARYRTTVELAERVKKAGGYFLDSPVTGGVAGAKAGTLTFMVGGDREAFESALEVYKAMGSHIVYIGESGHGQLTKMINQSIMNAVYCSVTENFAFAASHDMDLEKVYDAIENGGARSGLLSAMRQTILSGVPVENNNLKIMSKDSDYMTEECNRQSLFMPVQAAAQQVLNIGRKKGYSKFWTGSIFLIWEELTGRKFGKK